MEGSLLHIQGSTRESQWFRPSAIPAPNLGRYPNPESASMFGVFGRHTSASSQLRESGSGRGCGASILNNAGAGSAVLDDEACIPYPVIPASALGGT